MQEQTLAHPLESMSCRWLFDAAAEPMLLADAEARVLLANPALHTLLGYADGELAGMAVEALMPERYRHEHERHRARFAQQPAKSTMSQRRELLALRRDGTELPVEIGLTPLEADGRRYTLVALNDVSQRRRSEEELRKLSLAVAQAPVSIIITDLEARIQYVNPAFSLASGYSAEEAVGQNPRVLKSGRTPRERYRELWTSLKDGRTWRGEFINRRKDGSEYIEVATISPVRQADGRISHYLAVKEDITELKRTLGELRLSEERLRLAKSAAGLGIYDRDVTTGRLEWDERMRELWGVGPDEPVTFATFMGGVHPDDRAATQAAIDRALDPAGDGDYAAEYRVISRADGRERHLSATGQVLFESGRPVRIVGTVRDITGEKRMEQESRERRVAMETLLKQQVAAQTAAAIAHELNQPLISISAYNDAALRMLRGGSPAGERLARALEGSMAQSQRAGRTLHELIDFLHSGDTVAAPMDLREAIHEAIAIARDDGYGEFRPVLELEADLPPVLGNRLQVHKVLVNLLHNAVEAMRDAGRAGGAITIMARTPPGGRMAEVTVRDSGPGLDPVAGARVFEPFFTTKGSGIGLGLAISRALIEAHDGRMWHEPGGGPGATFHFTLPFAP